MMAQNEPLNTYTNPHSAYVNGEQILVYDNDKVLISALARLTGKSYGFGSEVKIALSVTNKGEEPVDFIPEESVAYEIRGSKKKELQVYSAKEYLKKMNKNILLFGPDNVENVANTRTEVKDGAGQKVGSVSTNTKVYTGAADKAYDNANKYVSENYLKRNTLMKGSEVGGIIAVKKPKGDSFEFHLRVGEDVYIFNFTIE